MKENQQKRHNLSFNVDTGKAYCNGGASFGSQTDITGKERKPENHQKVPVSRVGLLSYLSVGWMTSLMWKIYRISDRPLVEEDLWRCSDLESSSVNTDRILKEWKKELADKGPEKASLTRVWIRFIAKRLVILYLAVTVYAIVSFIMSGFLIEVMVSYLTSNNSSLAYGLSLVVAIFCGQTLRAILHTFKLMFASQTGIRYRAGILGLVFDKLLKLKTLKGNEMAKVVTIFGADAQRLYYNCSTFVYLLALPVDLTIGAIYIYHLIGLWCFIAVGIFIMCYQIQTCLSLAATKLRRKALVFTDKRIRKTTEVISNMRLIKMYAWEDSFSDRIKGIRKRERQYLFWSNIVRCLSAAIIPASPVVASVVTIASFRAWGNDLDTVVIFPLVSTLYFLKTVVVLLPIAFSNFGESRVSHERIKKLLIKEEYEGPSSLCEDDKNAVEIRNGVFLWETDNSDLKGLGFSKKTSRKTKRTYSEIMSGSTKFKRVILTVKKQRLIGVCGQVGCGKSSLLTAIIGRIPMLCGRIAVSGSVAYVAQQAWIFNGTVRDNILFGTPMDIPWYKEVIRVCGLEHDLTSMDKGDETEIGERGINLSGGQKQRVSLARAVYSRSDIYLLDDPMSAVDIHVGQHIFDKCIRQTLMGKTVILVTHQLQYLKHCDEILVMEDGGIVEIGSHETLMTLGGRYTRMVHASNSSSEHEKEIRGTIGRQKNITIANSEGLDGQNKEQTEDNLKIVKTNFSTGNIIKKEESEVGNVSWGTYRSYISSAGGNCVAVTVLLCYTLTIGVTIFSTWWLGIWISGMDAQVKTNISLQQSLTVTHNCDNKSTNLGSHTTTVESNNSFSVQTTQRSDFTSNQQPEQTLMDVKFYIFCSSLGGIILFTVLKAFVSVKATVTASGRLHNRVMESILRAPLLFFDSNPSGRILNRFSRDMDEGDVFIPTYVDALLQSLNSMILSFVVSSLTLPWIWLAILPVGWAFYMMKSISSVVVRQLKRFENTARSPLISHACTSVQGLSTIVTFKQQSEFYETCLKLIDVTSVGLFLSESSVRWIALRVGIVSSMIVVACSLTVVLSKGVVDPALSAMSLTLCLSTVSTMQFLLRIMNEVEAKFTSIERLHEYEKHLKQEIDKKSVVVEQEWPTEGSVLFSDVEMTYRDDLIPALCDVRFFVKPKEKIGIVGRTGAGKTSVVTALFRLVELTRGQILIDGVGISTLPLKTLRSKISAIPQDPALFAETIRYNLDPFDKFKDEEIWSSLEKAHMKDKILDLDERLDSVVEENGGNFSVGEKQLLCLSRAILRRNKILILDEATASIDVTTDSLIQQTIRESFSECTVLIIAHRLNTILHCDRVLVLNRGKIAEVGSPQELISDPHSFFNTEVNANL